MGIMLGNMSISNTYKADSEAPVIGALSSPGVTGTTVALEWTTATDNVGVTGYEVYVDGSLYTTIGNVLLYTVTGLTEGNNYDFSIKAFDATGNRSEFSNVVNVTPAGILPGLTDALITVPAQNNATWTLRSFDAGIYIGQQARLVIKHKTKTSGTTYQADVQVDDIKLGSTSWNPETGTNSFERCNEQSTTTTYGGATWSALANSTSGEYWLRDKDGTTSSSTGNTSGNTGSYYYYTETSSSALGQVYWLRSPVITIDNSTLEVYTAQNGSTCGQIDIYLDIQ